jgi:secondary thiamine-phosphate synthase enzyme
VSAAWPSQQNTPSNLELFLLKLIFSGLNFLFLPPAKTRNMVRQIEISLPAHPRGFHLITAEVLRHIGTLPDAGILHLFIQHTSAGLAINENADPSVLTDFEMIFNRLVPENTPGLTHTLEGPDDMPAHVKAVLSGNSVSIPISGGALNLGTWQGIYLCEFRNYGGRRRVVATIYF